MSGGEMQRVIYQTVISNPDVLVFETNVIP